MREKTMSVVKVKCDGVSLSQHPQCLRLARSLGTMF